MLLIIFTRLPVAALTLQEMLKNSTKAEKLYNGQNLMGKQTFCELRRKNISLMFTLLSTWYRENCKYNDVVNVTFSDVRLL